MRKLFGWERYETPAARTAINARYADWRIVQHLFQPSMKLVTKVRQGARLLRRYDTPKTPFQRVLEGQEAEHSEVKRLHRTLHATDPFELSKRIDHHLERLAERASRSKGTPRERPPGKPHQLLVQPAPNGQEPRRRAQPPVSPWRGWTFSKKLKQQQREMLAQGQRRFG